ncbi:MAG: histidine phosphatase family protein, partial [Lentisphaeria bacterium]|nr:histidine phosphatase family protein [Lentisphaeria bacterium]
MKKIFILLLIGILAHSSLAGRTVYITRHGQVGDTEYFDKAVREIKLTPLGKEQAQMLAEYLTDVKKFRGTV